MWFEYLYRTFFTQLLQAFLQLLHFQWVFDAHATEQFRREERNACVSEHFAFREAVANLNVAMIGNTNNVACKRFFYQFALMRHESHHAGSRDFTVDAQMLDFHAA